MATLVNEARVHHDGLDLGEKVRRALDRTDAFPPDIRRCVHELGYEPVAVMFQLGLTANQMRSVTHACWSAPRSEHQRQGATLPKTERSSPVLQHLDTLLSRAGANISAAMLLSFLRRHNMVVVPVEPSTPMVAASVATVATFDERVTKDEKHRRRLKAAIAAATARLWPGVE